MFVLFGIFLNLLITNSEGSSLKVNALRSEIIQETRFLSHKKWTRNGDKKDIKRLLLVLNRSQTGKKLINKTLKRLKGENRDLYDLIRVGRSSLTDTTLTREFSKSNPADIHYHDHSVIYINRDLNDFDALLDLAHELTHYLDKEHFNPYKKNFTLKEFIISTIEAKGGEVDAFLTECKVLKDLFPSRFKSKKNCSEVLESTGDSRELAKKAFYQVGPLFENFSTLLSQVGLSTQSFPNLSASKIEFISSAYSIPYPIAAFKEYSLIMQKVCHNEKKRMSHYRETALRAPSSLKKSSYLELMAKHKKQCSIWL